MSTRQSGLQILTVQEITCNQALEWWKNRQAVFIDVRVQWEYDEGHIPGVRLIPLDQFPVRLEEIPRQGFVVVVCRSGHRSAMAVGLLRRQGFVQAYSMTGGMLAWLGPVDRSVPSS